MVFLGKKINLFTYFLDNEYSQLTKNLFNKYSRCQLSMTMGAEKVGQVSKHLTGLGHKFLPQCLQVARVRGKV
jgi:hypothetical protein